ncbi:MULTISPECIES: TonB-dependent receptor [Acinetobacter]|uniref:TonB-dependent siderophore receptor n=1 Tax=Acinetobacter chengduensis TaxID=2420890 RepID=A0ABX9TZY3_9GAMM|nr:MULTISPECIES: TonB-dependent siderophore receptor [Acinetobacter]MBI1451588.1 TonB-dependent siderophore receptor [Acinetobacter sp. FL51]RKG42995.1 TonB-dependent siderophore receptor [Acinetobacter sp. WCHAc060007]RLL24490.1 TonB-dependent siderophore receptor [Acinetobacter chengduensis]
MSFIKTRKKIVSSAIASSLSVIAVNAIAQDQVTKLETIHQDVVTEQAKSLKVDKSANSKFIAPLLDTAKSVTVIPKQLIEDTQVTTLSDALRTVPGITLGAGEGGNPNGDRPFIRGYSSESSMYVDGVRNSSSQNREMFAVEQVEVTKGSASSMGGAGSVGGSINMISKVAKKGDFLEGSVGAGTDDYQRITLDGNKDFGNGVAARVAVMGHHNNKAGQGDDGAEYARFGIAPSITFGLDTDTRATLSYYYLKSDDTPDSGIPYSYGYNSVTGKNGVVGKPVNVPQGTYYGWLNRDFQKQENHIGTIKLEHDLNEDLTLSNVATYNKSKNDYAWTQPDDSQGNVANGKVWRRANSRITDTDTFSDQLSLKGKFNTGAFKHNFNTGIEYSHQKTDIGAYDITDPNTSVINGGACALPVSNGWCTSLTSPNSRDPWLGSISENKAKTTQTSKNTGVYFADNIEINPQWLIDLGLRWDKFDTELLYNQEATSGRGAAAVKIPAGTKYESDPDFWSYNLGVTFKPAKNGAIYASFATSANPVGINAGDGDNNENIGTGTSASINELKPEEARTFEIGTKWDLFDDKLNVTAAIFRTEKQNTRIAIDANTTVNAGESKVDGFELGLSGNITDKWAVFAGYSYLDSELTKVAYNDTASQGKQLPQMAKNSGTLWTTYDLTNQFTVGAGAVASDKVYGSSNNSIWVPGYVRYDAMARYNVNKNVDLQLNVNNLSDKRYFSKAYASHYTTEAEGRNAVLSVNFKY